MTSQAKFERDIWSQLYGHVHASAPDELLGLTPAEVQAWTDAEDQRYMKAVERVQSIIGRHFD